MLPEAVEAWQSSGRDAVVEGRRVFMRIDGEGGPDVLILHGFPASSFDWRNTVRQLRRHARVVSFDFPGYGLSEKPLDFSYSLFAQADVAEAVARQAGIERCVLVAHDMGDTVCAELVARHNAGRLSFGLDGVVLTNGSIFMHLVQLSAGQQLLLALPNEPLAESLPMDTFRPGIADTFSKEHQPSDEELDAMLALIAASDGDRLLPRLIRYIEERRANQSHWTSAFVEYQGPLAAVWGEQDPIAVVAMAHHLKELRPATDVTTWPDVGHWPSIEVPERLAAAILERL